MKFRKIHIEDAITKTKGINEITLTGLGNVVALVGKNGSGKTRVLDLLEDNLVGKISFKNIFEKEIYPIPKELLAILKAHSHLERFFLMQERIEDLNVLITANPKDSEIKVFQNERQKLKTHLPSYAGHDLSQALQIYSNIKKIIPVIFKKYVKRIKYSEIERLQDIITDKQTNKKMSFEDLIEKVTSDEEYSEFNSIHTSALSYLMRIPHELVFEHMEAFGDERKYSDKPIAKRYLSLKKLIKDFLNKDLTWEKKNSTNIITQAGVQSTASGIWKLNGREFNYTEFSDGEKLLFSYALLFFLIEQNNELNVKESVLLLDEPELHLHPESEIDLINGIKNVIGENGQLIFATHSINILSSLNFDEIFMVKNGEITHRNHALIGDSISELMGIEDRINKLSDFLSSISTWTFVNFMGECFSDPEVIEVSPPEDAQVNAFKEAIKKFTHESGNLLLDFGAGKGRLYQQIKYDFEFIKTVKYSALEPDKAFHAQLKELGADQVFENSSQLTQNTFDFILLCNVLHEIHITEWEETLNNIMNSLKINGYLIIIEAKILTKGEKIGKEGFLLLSPKELQTLFNLTKLPINIPAKGKEHIISCSVIHKSEMKQITKEQIEKTLQELEKNSFAKIIELRESVIESDRQSTSIGRKSAFLSQLYINSKIAQLKIKSN